MSLYVSYALRRRADAQVAEGQAGRLPHRRTRLVHRLGGSEEVTATFGIPDEWQDFERRHQLLLDKVLPPLMDACNQMVSRRMESQGLPDIVVFLLGRHVPEDFTEIMLLCA